MTCPHHTPDTVGTFLLTRLIRGMTSLRLWASVGHQFLLTRLIRGMTGKEIGTLLIPIISTHTPHTRHDRKIYEHFTITPQHIGGLNDKFLSNWFFNQKILILLS